MSWTALSASLLNSDMSRRCVLDGGVEADRCETASSSSASSRCIIDSVSPPVLLFSLIEPVNAGDATALDARPTHSCRSSPKHEILRVQQAPEHIFQFCSPVFGGFE